MERFLSICGQKMSKGFLKFCKLISNLILGQIIVSNLTNVQKLNSRINNARLHKLDIKTNTKYNNYPGLPFEMQLLKVLSKASIASDFSTLFTHQARWKTKTMPSKIGFLTLTSDRSLNQNTNKQTIHEWLLIAAVFHFVHPVEKDS